MADSSERCAGKPSAAAPGTPGGAKAKGKKAQGGRVVESRYLQYEKKVKKAPAAEAPKTSGKVAEGGRKGGLLQKSKDGSRTGKGALQSTMLEGHGAAPPDLDLSAINDKSMVRKTPQLDKTMSKQTKSASFTAPQKQKAELPVLMEMMESQTLLLTLLTVKMENNLAQLEDEAERKLSAVCRERERLQAQAHELRRRLLLHQKWQELARVLDAQIEMLSPLEAVAGHFREQYRTLATALDTTRHELPVCSIHLEGDGQQLLDALQAELRTTHQLLGEFGAGDSEENTQVLDLLSELKDVMEKKDEELQRTFSQVLELSAEASKEAALVNQDVWEEVQGPAAPRQWYFNPDGAFGDPQGELRSTVPSEDVQRCAL